MTDLDIVIKAVQLAWEEAPADSNEEMYWDRLKFMLELVRSQERPQ